MLLTTGPDIWFPHLGIRINSLSRVAFSPFGIDVYWYAICVMLGYLAGLVVLRNIARKTDQNPEMYSDYILYALILGLLGARIYYIIFSFDSYKDNLMKIFATREGGLAIYGGIIAVFVFSIFFTRKRKVGFGLFADTCGPAVAIGQVIGRIGNLFNREAFGGYTDSLFAMRIKVDQASYLPASIYEKIILIEDTSYIQVHPAFLYEMLWNLGLFVIMLLFRKHKKFDGQVFLIYVIGYGIGRFWIEGLRTDQLPLFGTGLAVSQILSALLALAGTALMIFLLKRPPKAASQLPEAPAEAAETSENSETHF